MNIFFTIYLLIINLCSLILMFVDKRKAIKQKWRIRENTLFLFSLIGGSFGTLLGMYLFRHKTNHLKFKIGVPGILIFQIFVLFFSFLN